MGGGHKTLEIKFKAAGHVLSGLPDSPLAEALTRGKGKWSHLAEALYDTTDRYFANALIALVLRKKGGKEVQIIERSASRRKEAAGIWRTALTKSAPFPADTGDVAIDEMLALHGPNLRKIMNLDIDRWKASFPFRNSILTFWIDLATATEKANGKRVSYPVAEASLRLKKGKAKDLFEAARLFLADGTLRLDAQSRHQASLAASQGRQFAPPRRSRSRLASGATAGDLLESSLAVIANRIILLQPLIIDARLEEGVHQMRVEFRRLRAIERAYRKTAAGAALSDIAIMARKIARTLGPARDWDVFTTKTLSAASKNGYAEEGFAQLQKKAQTARAKAWTSAVAEISSKDFTAFALAILELAYTTPWRKKKDPLLKKSVKKFAVNAQDKALEKTRRTAAMVDANDPASLHALRIAVKKLRYCNQLFRNVYSRKRRGAYMAAMASLQKAFGDINDAVTAQRLANIVSRGEGAKAMRASGFLSGYYAAQLDAASKAIATSWSAFEAMPPFWRKTAEDGQTKV